MATHSSNFAWRIPGMEARWAANYGVDRVGHDYCELAAAAALYILSNIFTLALEHVFSITKAPSGCKNVIFFFYE